MSSYNNMSQFAYKYNKVTPNNAKLHFQPEYSFMFMFELFMGKLHAGGQYNLGHLSLVHRCTHSNTCMQCTYRQARAHT